MSRDKFLRIKKYFHVADNQSLEKGNKVVKVAYLYKIMNEKLSQWQIFHKKAEPIQKKLMNLWYRILVSTVQKRT